MNSSEDDIYMDKAEISGTKPKISIEKRNEVFKKGYDSICKISIPDINKGNGFFCQIFYNRKNYNVLILNNKIISKEQLKNEKYLKINYENKNILILVENKILNIKYKNQKYSFIEINNDEIKTFYKLDNFIGEFNEEMINEIKKKGNKFICEILFDILGNGFFCQIPYNNNNINVLFTNNHIINKNLLLVGQKIRLYYKQKYKEIEITENRLVFTDSRNYKEGFDYTCIQIFNEDG